MGEKTLTDKQLAFIDAYCIDWNAASAARAAGYADKYSAQTAQFLLSNPLVTNAIEAKKKSYALNWMFPLSGSLKNWYVSRLLI